jgi:hypothetical protein
VGAREEIGLVPLVFGVQLSDRQQEAQIEMGPCDAHQGGDLGAALAKILEGYRASALVARLTVAVFGGSDVARVACIIGYLWAAPMSALGLFPAVLSSLSGGTVRIRDGVVEAHGGLLGSALRCGTFRTGGAAVTLGHVILARNADCLERSRKHELHHVRQYERWGPLLVPVYWLIGAWLSCRGYHPYLDHPLEPPPD